jgi:hypothetical protein
MFTIHSAKAEQNRFKLWLSLALLAKREQKASNFIK